MCGRPTLQIPYLGFYSVAVVELALCYLHLIILFCSELSSPTSFSPSVMAVSMSASGIGYGRSALVGRINLFSFHIKV